MYVTGVSTDAGLGAAVSVTGSEPMVTEALNPVSPGTVAVAVKLPVWL